MNQISKIVKAKKVSNYVVRPNAEIVTLAQTDSQLKQTLNKADLSIPDGIGVVIAASLLGLNLKERFGGPESMLDIVTLAEKNNFSVYLLGSKAKTVAKAAKNLQKKYKSLKLVGYQSGYFNKNNTIVKEINDLKPNIVFVGMGAPRQEKWIWENQSRLTANLLVCEGGSFDYLAGEVRRAPVFIRKIGFDWLFRLAVQPWRLKRQLSLVKFTFLVLKARFWA